MSDATVEMRSNLNWPFAFFGIICCILLLPLGAVATFLFLIMLLSGAFVETPTTIMLLLPAILGCGSVRIAAVAIGDLMLPRPTLKIGNTGILDQRLGCGLIAWGDIAQITSLDPQQAGLLIEVKTPVHAKFSRMRAGAFGVIWRLPPSSVYVAMQEAMGPYIEVKAVADMARAHGVPMSFRRISKATGRSVPA